MYDPHEPYRTAGALASAMRKLTSTTAKWPTRTSNWDAPARWKHDRAREDPQSCAPPIMVRAWASMRVYARVSSTDIQRCASLILAGPAFPLACECNKQARTIDVLRTIWRSGGRLIADCQGVQPDARLQGQSVATPTRTPNSFTPKMNMGWAELRAIRSTR